MESKQEKRERLEKEIEFLNTRMKSKRFAEYKDHEKEEYIDEILKRFEELKPLVGFGDRIKIGIAVKALHYAKGNLYKGSMIRDRE